MKTGERNEDRKTEDGRPKTVQFPNIFDLTSTRGADLPIPDIQDQQNYSQHDQNKNDLPCLLVQDLIYGSYKILQNLVEFVHRDLS